MQNAGGASSRTDTRIRMSVDSDRAQVVTSGVSSPHHERGEERGNPEDGDA